MIPPRLPFPGYKWRWATLTPTEGLNEPPIFLGVIRVLRENQGRPANSPEIREGLERVERDVAGQVNTTLRLVRPDERNLLRNSQQYWKALGVLQPTRMIRISSFGEAVADGTITRDEFSTTIVVTLELPNRSILRQEEIEIWDRAGIRIKPLALILDVMRNLGTRYGAEQSYLTPDELTRVVIPLAGDRSTVMDEYMISIIEYRAGRLDLQGWPDCVPDDNDPRMAREFLLFLAYYGFCSISSGDSNALDKFAVQESLAPDLQSIIELRTAQVENRIEVADQVREAGVAAFVERQRAMRLVLQRPLQTRFRRDVLEAYRSECLVTRERIPETLEAAHIIPVEYHGADAVGNGICLRSDIHSLFDAGHLRINPRGQLVFSDAVRASVNYHRLPPQIHIPQFVLPDALEWRWRYQ
jgi:hypothetical protein